MKELIMEKIAVGVLKSKGKVRMSDTWNKLGRFIMQIRVYHPHCCCDHFNRKTRHIERSNYLIGLRGLKNKAL